MVRGLLWLPLLAVFIGLAWAGWREFRKVETYQTWAQDYEQAKYDILAVIGVAGDTLTWGLPTPDGPKHLNHFDLKTVEEVTLWANGQPLESPSKSQKPNQRCSLQFTLPDSTIEIPFTDLSIAANWCTYLQKRIQAANSASS